MRLWTQGVSPVRGGLGFFACASMVVLAMTFPHNDHHDPRNSHEQEIAVLSRMGQPIRCLAFSSDGSMLATIGWDQSALVLQPIMPLDLPVKVRSWELTVYPRSHIRR